MDFQDRVELENRTPAFVAFFTLIIVLPAVLTTAATLYLHGDEHCDQPLASWALAQISLLTIVLPASCVTTSPCTGGWTSCRLSRVRIGWSSVLFLLQLLLCAGFLVGNILVFSSDDCSWSAPRIYKCCIVLIGMQIAVLLFPLMASILLILGSLFCIPFLGVILLRYLWLGGGMAVHGAGFGLEAEELDRLPLTRMVGDDGGQCVVCLGHLVEGELVRRLPACVHVFHQACIDEWLGVKAVCPVCRAAVVPGTLEGHMPVQFPPEPQHTAAASHDYGPPARARASTRMPQAAMRMCAWFKRRFQARLAARRRRIGARGAARAPLLPPAPLVGGTVGGGYGLLLS